MRLSLAFFAGLVSGGVYMHPESSKKQVARAILKGFTRAKGRVPRVRLAYDSHAFEDAFKEMETSNRAVQEGLGAVNRYNEMI